MSKTDIPQNVIDAFKTVIVASYSMDEDKAKFIVSVLPTIIAPYLTPRQNVELSIDIGRELHKESGEHPNCNCEERHTYLLDVLDHLEKQKLKPELIMEFTAKAVEAWKVFESKFGKAPVLTFVDTDLTLDIGVPGVFFMNPNVVH